MEQMPTIVIEHRVARRCGVTVASWVFSQLDVDEGC